MMRNLLLYTLIFFATQPLLAQSPYEQAMTKALQQFSEAESIDNLQTVANAFERISQKETQEWLPLYYESLTYVIMGFDNSASISERDRYYKQAEELANKAAILETNSEITALKGYVVMGQLSVDPAGRGQSLSSVAINYFQKAIEQNPGNPRALFLMAQMEYGAAQFFGESTENACATLRKAVNQYEKEESNALMPIWGKSRAVNMLNQCK
ncbi:hypothetical protein [Fulvivirga sediminis]|uniref:Tetratricopeptide repeat protein n=1 Tax=Fulvivirga sediminis TaxID=2803949 RepID=A0A937F775_9BACT|nr:hypothetical protein [Fulvivirga sediminis]MBL3656302.1 hypothetical protein [Fulvivirga sediminis]